MSGFQYIPEPEHGAAWVTGASAGIGRAVALKLAAEGWTVYTTARSAEKLETLAAEHPNIRPAPGDVTDPGAMRRIVAEITEQQPLALTILNAGIYIPMRAQEFSAEDAAKTFDVNLTGVANGLDPVLKTLFRQQRGCVALVASVAGYRGLPRAAPYSATKAALISMAECLAYDLAPKGLRICVINPGFVETEATAVNDFEMPFLMKTDQAADHMVRGLKRPGFEIAFPTPFVMILKTLGLLRHRSYLWVMRKLTGWDSVEA
ncbi:MAG: SDR family NAD(P)-dependent oxidoreductase [Rhodobacteraceae bacterium]|nr:SDR family NAD(P)-dependent oxidoreductase [Paracoccaceae bacterium]